MTHYTAALPAQYRYFAFISYKRADSRWADYLYAHLQRYRLPVRLCRAHRELPKKLCPVFLDKQELPPGPLKEQLKANIAASKFFISVCSRHTQDQPQYIDLELQYFLETHDNDYTKVIPFIVDASDHPETECFSPGLQALNAAYTLIGANIHEKGTRRALLKVVAYMHGLAPAEIESEDDRLRRRNGLLLGLAGLCALWVCGVGIRHYWDHLAVQTSYFRGYILENNVAKGVGEISKGDLSDYARYYCIQTVDDRVQSVSHHNAAGTLVPPPEETNVLSLGAAKIEFLYTGEAEKRLHKAIYYGYNSLPIVCCRYSEDGTRVTLEQDESSGVSAYMDQGIGILSSGSALRLDIDKVPVTRYLQELDEAGRLVKRYYAYGENYRKTADGEGIFGCDFAYDDAGNLTEVSYFSSADGMAPGESGGVGTVRYTYNELQRLTSVSFLDGDGLPVNGAEGWATLEYTWHDNHQIAGKSYRDAEGQPALIHGYASLENTYDGTTPLGTAYYGPDGQPVLSDEGYASVTYRINQWGEYASYRYWDLDGNPVVNASDGTYGKELYRTGPDAYYYLYVNADGQPMMTSQGYAYLYVTEDPWRFPLRMEYRDTDNRLCTERYAVSLYQYDPVFHHTTEWRILDHKEKPTLHPTLDFAAVVTQYDSRGFMTLLEYRDETGALYCGSRDYARVEASCVPDGTNMLETYRYFDEKDTPVLAGTVGAYGVEYLCSESGKLLGICYLDGDERPYVHETFGFAGVNYLYDENGYIDCVAYYGENGRDIVVDGFASMYAKHDDHGNVLWREYHDTAGDLAFNEKEGCAGMIAAYENDRLVSLDYFGAENGEAVPAVNPLKGFASQRITYNRWGRIEQVHYLGPDGLHMNHLHTGYAAVAFTYDEAGNLTGGGQWKLEDGVLVPAE